MKELIFFLIFLSSQICAQTLAKYELMTLSGHYVDGSDDIYGYTFEAIYRYHPSLHTYLSVQENLLRKNLSAGVAIPLDSYGNLAIGINLQNDDASQLQFKYYNNHRYFINYFIWNLGDGNPWLEINYDYQLTSLSTIGCLLNNSEIITKVGINYKFIHCEMGWIDRFDQEISQNDSYYYSLLIKLK